MKKYQENRFGLLLSYRDLFLLVFFALSIIVLYPSRGAAQTIETEDWVGSYYFTDVAASPKRRKFTDVALSASYDITVEQSGGNLTAQFSAQGVQLAEAYDCSVKIRGDKAEFYFQKLAIEGEQNFRKFKNGNLLFSLTKMQIGKQTKYLLQSAAYKIVRVSSGKQRESVYFEKPRNNYD